MSEPSKCFFSGMTPHRKKECKAKFFGFTTKGTKPSTQRLPADTQLEPEEKLKEAPGVGTDSVLPPSVSVLSSEASSSENVVLDISEVPRTETTPAQPPAGQCNARVEATSPSVRPIVIEAPVKLDTGFGSGQEEGRGRGRGRVLIPGLGKGRGRGPGRGRGRLGIHNAIVSGENGAGSIPRAHASRMIPRLPPTCLTTDGTEEVLSAVPAVGPLPLITLHEGGVANAVSVEELIAGVDFESHYIREELPQVEGDDECDDTDEKDELETEGSGVRESSERLEHYEHYYNGVHPNLVRTSESAAAAEHLAAFMDASCAAVLGESTSFADDAERIATQLVEVQLVA
jgi:hypothetical protein